MKTEDELRAFFDSELRDDLQEIERLRGAALGRTFVALMVFAAAALGFVSMPVLGFAGPVIGAVAVIAGIVLAVGARKRYKTFRNEFKRRVVGSVIRFIDPAFAYEPDRHIPQSVYERSGIFRTDVDEYDGDDLVSGRIDKTEFAFSELHTQYETTTTDGDGNTTTQHHTIFKGLFFCADFNKHFRGETYVLPDTAERLFGFLGSTLQKWNRTHGRLVQLEDPEFEKEFVVYGSDQIEARYILSPALMERILEFKRKSKRKVHLSFTHSWVHVAVELDRDLFEASMWRSRIGHDKVLEYFRDLVFAFGIVENLNLNTRIWTKE